MHDTVGGCNGLWAYLGEGSGVALEAWTGSGGSGLESITGSPGVAVGGCEAFYTETGVVATGHALAVEL